MGCGHAGRCASLAGGQAWDLVINPNPKPVQAAARPRFGPLGLRTAGADPKTA